jgi:hypothetical protein
MEELFSPATESKLEKISEKYWAKVYITSRRFLKFQSEIYENEMIDDTMSIAKQIKKRRFFTAYGAKKWAEKTIINFEQSFFIKDYEIIRRTWNG